MLKVSLIGGDRRQGQAPGISASTVDLARKSYSPSVGLKLIHLFGDVNSGRGECQCISVKLERRQLVITLNRKLLGSKVEQLACLLPYPLGC